MDIVSLCKRMRTLFLICLGLCSSMFFMIQFYSMVNERKGKVIDCIYLFENKFQYSLKNIVFESGTKKRLDKNLNFYSVPYSSRWVNSHFIGFEVTPETALNAIADQYSIFYDDGSVSGSSEINNIRKGPGYGLVCSAFVCLIMGNAYPQTNYGMMVDSNFIKNKYIYPINSGIYINKKLSHSVYVSNVGLNNLKLSECASGGIKTKGINFTSVISSLNKYNNFITVVDRNGYDANFYDFDNIKLTLGNVRPWRGNKCVYGNWDKSADGSGIILTLHNNPRIVYMKKPDGVIKKYFVNNSYRYLNVSDDVDVDGIYEIYSDLNQIKEYFKYYNTPAVQMKFSKGGKISFSDSNVEYCYIVYRNEKNENKSLVLAKNKIYKTIYENINNIVKINAAIIRDPATECWGRYSVICNLANY